mgnify:CR=1 FL=1
MPVLKEKLGESGYKELEDMITDKIKLYSVSRDEFREVLSRLDIIENDVSDLKEEVSKLGLEMNERFDRINERFDRMNESINERFDRMNESINQRFDRMNESINERFDRMSDRMASLVKWTVGTLALFGTIISILIAIGQFVK